MARKVFHRRDGKTSREQVTRTCQEDRHEQKRNGGE